jgi:AcrR family transcriptional regulator
MDTTEKTSDRREQLVSTALRLIYQGGIHATGIDTILAESGVAKMTLYKYFRTKEELVVAALRKWSDTWHEWFGREVTGRSVDPRERLLAVYDAIGIFIHNGGPWAALTDRFSGCPFINAAGEFSDAAHPIHALGAEHKRRTLGFIENLARQAGARDPSALASSLALLAEGAVVMAHAAGVADAAERARRAAQILIASELGPSSTPVASIR